MKKFLIAFSFACTSLSALPIGNPQAPAFLHEGIFWKECPPISSWRDCLSLQFGYYGDFVFDRQIENVEMIDMGMPPNVNFPAAEMWTNAAIFDLNIWNKIDFYATLGITNFFAFQIQDGVVLEATLRPQFSWSLGARAILWEWCGNTFGGEAQYFQFSPEVDTIAFAGSLTVSPALFLKMREWQLGLAVSRQLGNFVPYIGVKWASFRIKVNDGSRLKNRRRVGFGVGVSLIDCGPFYATVEARFVDEKALHINGVFRF